MLIELADKEYCDLIPATWGRTVPARADAGCDRGGGAAPMRQESLRQVPIAILSRQIAAHRGPCLVINMPAKPTSIEFCLNAVFPAVLHCLDLIGAATLETDETILKTFGPRA